ncbi:MAG: DUF6377 domain-containing protein [Candidatus Symbiothrix sp.]|jgi:hypothetical protein|nr:DUF6377 domain-containing protein [Candidatus Symbiothrix sp.]
MKKFTLLLLLLLFMIPGLQAKSEMDSIFQVLFQALNNEKIYTEEKGKDILDIKKMIDIKDITDEQRYSVYDRLYDEYKSFKIDSAVHYLEFNLKIAEKLNNVAYIYNTKLKLSFSYWIRGRFLESINILDELDRSCFDSLPKWLLIEYYESYKRIYLYYSAKDKNNHYYPISNLYRDSLLHLIPEDSFSHRVLTAEKLAVEDHADEAIRVLTEALEKSQAEDHERAILENIMANIYGEKHNIEMQKKYYALSAICDIKNAIKENASMMELAFLLYEGGEIDKSYRCIKASMDDAVFCNARFRTFEISKVFPIIEQAYQEKGLKQKRELQVYLLIVSFLSLFLIVAVGYVYGQMKRIARIRKEFYRTNLKLNDLNTDLQKSNEKLHELNGQLSDVNQKLAETNRVKEAYLGKFIDLCSNYIEKLDNYRRGLNKIANSGKIDQLLKSLKSSQFIEDELSDFYTNFDETFLRIYPTFISDFNDLFSDEEKQHPKQGELLNTELRVYALIRLGINDSAKIAVFLRYSITTVYTYRSKLKSKSLQPKKFEEYIMKIGSY